MKINIGKITKEDQILMHKRASREIALESPKILHTVVKNKKKQASKDACRNFKWRG